MSKQHPADVNTANLFGLSVTPARTKIHWATAFGRGGVPRSCVSHASKVRPHRYAEPLYLCDL
jgi:hypothetical protein